MSAERFIADEVARLRAKATDLEAWGATDAAATCGKVATELEANWRAYWLADLDVATAAEESGYTEDHLRSLVRDHKLPAAKGNGTKGHLRIARCNLPHRAKPAPSPVASLEERLLRKRDPLLQKPA